MVDNLVVREKQKMVREKSGSFVRELLDTLSELRLRAISQQIPRLLFGRLSLKKKF